MAASSTKQQPAQAPLPRKTVLRADMVESARLWATMQPGIFDHTIWDTATPGFGLRVRRRYQDARARLIWVARAHVYGKRDSGRYSLGEHPAIGIAAARAECLRVLSSLRSGKTPADARAQLRKELTEARAARRSTWAWVMDAYQTPPPNLMPEEQKAWLRRYRDRALAAKWVCRHPSLTTLANTPLMQLDVEVVHKSFDPLLKLAPISVTPGKAREPFGGAGNPGGSLSSLLKLARHCRHAWNDCKLPRPALNPFAAWFSDTEVPAVPPRQGALTMTGKTDAATASRRWLLALLSAREDPGTRTHADHLLLCLLWGSRSRETALLTWADVQFDNEHPHILFRAATTKTGRAALRPLLPWAREILKSRHALAKKDRATSPGDPVFWSPLPELRHRPISAPGNALLRDLDAAAWPEPPARNTTRKRITAHDLRRTVAAGLYSQTLNLESVAMALGHASAESVTTGYIAIVSRLQAFAPIYAAWERQLRRYLELPPLEPDSAAAPAQPVPPQLVDVVLTIAASHGLTVADLLAALSQRA